MYESTEDRAYKEQVRLCASVAMKGRKVIARPTDGIKVYIDVSKVYPKGMPKKRRKESRYCLTKPDVDNIAKIILDGMNGTVYEDDAAVSLLVVRKTYTEEQDGVVVKVKWEE